MSEDQMKAPITPAILEKNGFEKKNDYTWYNASIHCVCQRFGRKYWYVRIVDKNRKYRPAILAVDDISHIYQLQYAMKVAGIEKELEL